MILKKTILYIWPNEADESTYKSPKSFYYEQHTYSIVRYISVHKRFEECSRYLNDYILSVFDLMILQYSSDLHFYWLCLTLITPNVDILTGKGFAW